MMHQFNVEGPRFKDEFSVFNDVCKILQYLYANKDNVIKLKQGSNTYNLIMDADKNLLIRPAMNGNEKITESKDDLYYVCNNHITYKQLIELAERLREEGQMDEIISYICLAQVI